jgi:hypothetical protein
MRRSKARQVAARAVRIVQAVCLQPGLDVGARRAAVLAGLLQVAPARGGRGATAHQLPRDRGVDVAQPRRRHGPLEVLADRVVYEVTRIARLARRPHQAQDVGLGHRRAHVRVGEQAERAQIRDEEVPDHDGRGAEDLQLAGVEVPHDALEARATPSRAACSRRAARRCRAAPARPRRGAGGRRSRDRG